MFSVNQLTERPMTLEYVMDVVRSRLGNKARQYLDYWSSGVTNLTTDSFPSYGIAQKLSIRNGEKVLYPAHAGGEWLLSLSRDLPSSDVVAFDFDRRMNILTRAKGRYPRMLALSVAYNHLYNPYGRSELCQEIESLHEDIGRGVGVQSTQIEHLVNKSRQHNFSGFKEALEDWSKADSDFAKRLTLMTADANWPPLKESTFDVSVTYESARCQFDWYFGVPYLRMLQVSDRVVFITDPNFYDEHPLDVHDRGFVERDFSLLGTGNPLRFMRAMIDNLCEAYQVKRTNEKFWNEVYYGHYIKNPTKDHFNIITLSPSTNTRDMIAQDLDFVKCLLQANLHPIPDFPKFRNLDLARRIFGADKADESLERLRMLTKSERERYYNEHFYGI